MRTTKAKRWVERLKERPPEFIPKGWKTPICIVNNLGGLSIDTHDSTGESASTDLTLQQVIELRNWLTDTFEVES